MISTYRDFLLYDGRTVMSSEIPLENYSIRYFFS